MSKLASSFTAEFLVALLVIAAVAQTSRAQETATPDGPSTAEVAALIEAVRSNTPDQNVYARALAVGNSLLRAARYVEAHELLAALAEKQPANSVVIYSYALASFNTGRVSEAAVLAQHAVGIAQASNGPDRAQRGAAALVLLGVIRAVLNDDAGALRALRDAVALVPGDFDAQFALGRQLFGMGDDIGAVKAFRAARALQPENSQALFFLATSLERANEIQEALSTYRQLTVLSPDRYEGHLGLGVLLLKRNAADQVEGIKELERALEINPNLYEAHIALGRAFIASGRLSDAVPHLQRAAEIAPNNPEPHYQLSLAYRRLGRKQEAANEAAIVKRIHDSRRNPGS